MLTVTRNDSKTITYYFYDSTNTAVDLTGASLFVTVKQNKTDTDAEAKIATTLTILVPSSGIATWDIKATDTQYLLGQYYYDIQLVDALGEVTTLINDVFNVVSDITIRTS